MTNDLLEQLLFGEESDSLDFKRDQYPFVGASDDEKSELLKDVLAFANSWCRSDAYILIGVDDVRGDRAKIIGLTGDLDDANLQQFVNAKVNRPVNFAYRALSTPDGPKIGVIQIPRQTRPLYLKKDFGKLKAGAVYVRRGSSTDIATPDEIAHMGAIVGEQKETGLQLRLFDLEDKASYSSDFRVIVHDLRYDRSSIPNYGKGLGNFGFLYEPTDNREYYRERAEYERATAGVRPFRLEIENNGAVLLSNVRVKMRGVASDLLVVTDGSEIPDKPERQKRFLVAGLGRNYFPQPAARRSLDIDQDGPDIKVFGQMLDIQPKDTVRSNDLIYFGGGVSGTIALEATVYADNLENPASFKCSIQVDVVSTELAIDQLIRGN